MDAVWENLRSFAIESLPSLVTPVAILVVGWIVALVVGSLVRRGLDRTGLDERLSRKVLGEERAREVDTARWAGRIAYYIVLALTLVGFLQAIQLTAATEPISGLLSEMLEFVPNLIGAVVIALVAWIVAASVRALLSGALSRWGADERLNRAMRGEQAPAQVATAGEAPTEPGAPAEKEAPLGRALADAGYWLVWLMFTPAILDALQLDGLLVPVQDMVGEALVFLPHMASAALVVVVGWLVARIVQRLVTSALASTGLDRIGARVGLGIDKTAAEAAEQQPHLVRTEAGALRTDRSLSGLIGLVAYALILIPVAIGALEALQLESVTTPASAMLEQFFAAVPSIFGGALVIAVAYIVARLLYGVVHRLLNGLGFDRVLVKMGFTQEQLGERTPSQLVGGLVMVAVIYFSAVEAARMLEFDAFAALAIEFSVLAGHILLGLVIFGFGLYASRLAAEAIRDSGVNQERVLSSTARIAILALAGAMALRQMGIADEIIELAFGLGLGAVAIAVALAFGLGGRDAASKTIENARQRFENDGKRKTRTAGGGSSAQQPVTAAKEP